MAEKMYNSMKHLEMIILTSLLILNKNLECRMKNHPGHDTKNVK